MRNPGNLQQPTVLVVDDSEDDFETVCVAARLAQVTAQFVNAIDTDAALRMLDASSPGDFVFMLLDFNFPGVDGLTFLQELRQHPVHGQMPVVVFTASVNPRDQAAFLAAGADAFHVKTVRFDDCLQILTDIFAHWLVPPSTIVAR
ncbi:response regulator [Actimicrobium antarcticum]|uniref:Response regulatory domain-containing protein n=1 Tax=Actimicrobium antarcticum TaxID=1051899 RepID=A0ABP7TXN3_9BURK